VKGGVRRVISEISRTSSKNVVHWNLDRGRAAQGQGGGDGGQQVLPRGGGPGGNRQPGGTGAGEGARKGRNTPRIRGDGAMGRGRSRPRRLGGLSEEDMGVPQKGGGGVRWVRRRE